MSWHGARDRDPLIVVVHVILHTIISYLPFPSPPPAPSHFSFSPRSYSPPAQVGTQYLLSGAVDVRALLRAVPRLPPPAGS